MPKCLSTACLHFYQYLDVERRYSKHTVLAYRRDLSCFIAFCETMNVITWDVVNDILVRAYIIKQHKKGLSGRSLQRHLSSMRHFYRYLARYHDAIKNPTEGIKSPKYKRRLPSTLTVEQLNKLLTNDKNNNDWLFCRGLALLEVLYGSGLRLAEIVGLDLNDINWHDQVFLINGKGNKQRYAPFGQMAEVALKNWLIVRNELANNQEKAVFVGHQSRRITPGCVQQQLKKWAHDRALGVPLTPHMLRHSYALHIMESSNDLFGVQRLLGHENITSTQVYLQLDFKHIASVYDKTHPRAFRKKVVETGNK